MHVNPKPPAEIAFVSDIIGAEATLKFVESFGGITIYIPHEAGEESPLVAAIGFAAAQLLASHLGGERVKVPLLKFWRIVVYRNQGLTYSEIARKVGTAEGVVWQHLSRRGMTGPGKAGTPSHAVHAGPKPRAASDLRAGSAKQGRVGAVRPSSRGR